MARFVIAQPRGLSWTQWTASLVIDLASSYNLPNPVDEGLWRAWARELRTVQGLAALSIPDDLPYERWQDWAADLAQTVL